jgi:hypothetical protein
MADVGSHRFYEDDYSNLAKKRRGLLIKDHARF